METWGNTEYDLFADKAKGRKVLRHRTEMSLRLIS